MQTRQSTTITTKQNTHKTQNSTVQWHIITHVKSFLHLLPLKPYLSNCKIGVHFSKCSPSLLFLAYYFGKDN